VSVTLFLLAGVLVGTGVYLLLTRSLIRIVFGVGLFANGVNLFIVAASGPSGAPAFVGADGTAPESATDPLPQAFVLTAIVISLALVAFLSALAWRSWTIDGLDEVEDDLEDRRLAAERAARDLARLEAEVAEELAPADHEWVDHERNERP
jgi:multicomponent Na+:H+ antiporter subunit C